MKTALVTGAGGMIGHQLVNKLKKQGYWVRGVDLKYPDYSVSLADDFLIGDLRDRHFVSFVMFSPFQKSLDDKDGSFDEAYFLAAQMGGAGYIFTGENDSDIIYSSALININSVEEARKFNVKKVFFSSSACAYSEDLQLDVNSAALKESTAWRGKPDSVYGVEKLFSEQLYMAYHKNYGMDIKIARFHNIFSTECTYDGGREKFPAAICRKVAEAKNGDYIEIWGDGEQTRSFLWIDECLEGVERLMNSNYHEPLNIGSDFMISINDMAKMVINISGKDLKLKHIESNALGVRGRNSDNTLIKEVLGWSPTQPLEDGLVRTYAWINQQVHNAPKK